MSSLLATLRPSGVLGDLNDATFLALEDGGVSQLLAFGWSPVVGAEGSGTIERVDLYARWSFYSSASEQPDPNTLQLTFREGSGGAVRVAGSWAEDLTGNILNAGPYSPALSESGAPWDWAKVLTLQLQMECQTSGHGISSGAAVYELWAEVWGVPASLSPRPSVVVSNVFDRISGSAILKTKEAYASVLDRVSAFGVFPTGDEDMNAAAVQALIDASVHKKLMSGKWLTLMHTGATSSSVPGIRSSGYEERLWRGAAEIRLPSGGNKAFTSALFNSVDDGAFPQPGLAQDVLWNTAWEWRMAMNCMTMLPAAGQCYQGIMVGGPIFTTTPWDGNETAMYVSGAQPFVQLRNNLTRGKWELVVWSQVDESGENVVPMEVTDCTYNPTFLPDQFITEATLRYDPAPNGGSVLRAYLNKQLAATVSSPALQLFRGGSVTCRAGFFATSGTTGAAVTDAIFYEGHWWSDTRSEWSAE